MSKKTRPRQSVRHPFGVFAVVFLGLVTLGLYAGFWRGIWFDELLHFATGGMTFEYVIKSIDYTSIHVNHGQTGAYIFIDWLLMQAFGANLFVLRLPSLISGIALLASAVIFMRAKGFGTPWQALAIMALAANEALMFYIGEARPYMPLAASSAAMLAYYSLDYKTRKTWWARLLGIFGFLFGAIIHPYWLFMWLLIGGYSFFLSKDSRGFTKGQISQLPRSAWKFLAPQLVIPSVVLYVLIGQLTWMRKVIDFGWDKNEIYPWSTLISGFLQNHFSFIPYFYGNKIHAHSVDAGLVVPIILTLLITVTILWIGVNRRFNLGSLLPPTFLILTGLGASLFASYLSYRSSYYIFERQWVAGAAITAIALTWLFAQWWKITLNSSWLFKVPSLLYIALIGVSFGISAYSQFQINMDRKETWQVFASDNRTIDELMVNPGEETFLYDPLQGYEYLANVNVTRGGPVWEVFVRWYNQHAGMRQEYREQDDNWSETFWPNPAPQSFLCLPERQWECPIP